jgi:hypothetical protein
MFTAADSQGRGKVVRRAPGLGGCHRERAAARRPAPSSRQRTNRRVALTSAGGEHSLCRSEPLRILQSLGEGAGRDHRRSEPTILTLPRPWADSGGPSSIVTELKLAAAGGSGEIQRGGVVRAEHSAAALQRVLAQGAGRLSLAHLDPGSGEGGRRRQGGGVVGSEHPVATLQRVLAQDAGLLHTPCTQQRRPRAPRGSSWRRSRCGERAPCRWCRTDPRSRGWCGCTWSTQRPCPRLTSARPTARLRAQGASRDDHRDKRPSP